MIKLTINTPPVEPIKKLKFSSLRVGQVFIYRNRPSADTISGDDTSIFIKLNDDDNNNAIAIRLNGEMTITKFHNHDNWYFFDVDLNIDAKIGKLINRF